MQSTLPAFYKSVKFYISKLNTFFELEFELLTWYSVISIYLFMKKIPELALDFGLVEAFCIILPL